MSTKNSSKKSPIVIEKADLEQLLRNLIQSSYAIGMAFQVLKAEKLDDMPRVLDYQELARCMAAVGDQEAHKLLELISRLEKLAGFAISFSGKPFQYKHTNFHYGADVAL
jgi:hypothetical protein